jgi:hypothetical protein
MLMACCQFLACIEELGGIRSAHNVSIMGAYDLSTA